MIRYILVLCISLAAGCTGEHSESTSAVSHDSSLPSSQPASADAVVDQLFAEISAMAKDYPELTQFPIRVRPYRENGRAEVRYSYSVKGFSEMRETRSSDLGTNGAEILFLVLDEPNEAWTTGEHPDTHLMHLRKRVYSYSVFSSNPSPGLAAKITSLLDKHVAFLVEMDKQAANRGSGDRTGDPLRASPAGQP